jgi:D-proline reductase (dithiol) PrdB
MQFERVDLADVDQLYIRMHERWWASHGDVMAYVKNHTIAFTRPSKPASEATVALISTGGVHLRDQVPFDMKDRIGDSTARFIPGDASPGDLCFTHDHYDHTSADVDPNCMFPLAHLRAFAAEGRIGAAAPIHAGLSGWIPRTDTLTKATVPHIIAAFKDAGVDAALLTGG